MNQNLMPQLYPEITPKFSLTQVIWQRLQREDSLLSDPLADEGTPLGSYWVELRRFGRNVQVACAVEQRLFLLTFWEHGVQLVRLSTTSLDGVIRATRSWLELQEQPSKFAAQVPGSRCLPEAPAYEAGPAAYVEQVWQYLRPASRRGSRSSPTEKLVEAAYRVPELRQLLPYTSMTSLKFSRCTGFPFTQDCPSLYPIGKTFRVEDHTGRTRGEGSLQDVVHLAVGLLPTGLGPAVHGTAEEIEEAPSATA